MKSSFCIDLQRFMLIPTKFPLTRIAVCAQTFGVAASNNKVGKIMFFVT